MAYAEVRAEVCIHRCSSLCCDCHLLRTDLNNFEDKTSHLTSTNYSTAQFREHLESHSVFCPKIKHALDKTVDGSISRLNRPTQLKFASSNATCRSDVKSTTHSVMTSTSSCICKKKSEGSYQLQRYLKEPAGNGPRLFIAAGSTQCCMDLLDSSKRNGKQHKERRKAAMGKKLKAIEKKIAGV